MKLTKYSKLILTGLGFLIILAVFTKVISMENTIIVLETNKGIIKISIDEENAPITAKNFIKYVDDGFYDDLIFHRVISDFMIQGGGFTIDGVEKETREPIQLESNNGLKNLKGTIAMARTMIEDSASSQFFINLKDNSFLDYTPSNPGYAVFGKVIEGMSVVESIEAVKTTTKAGFADWPVDNVIIIKAYVE